MNNPEQPTLFDQDARTFDEQFQAVQTIESRGGHIGVVEVMPANLPEGEVPIVMAGGWTEGPAAFKDTMEELYERGRWVIAVDHPTHGNTVEARDDHPEVKLFKAANYEDVLEAKGIEQADVIAHSAGAGDAVVWATLSDRVRNLVLTNPEGMIGTDSFPRLIARFSPKMARSIGVSAVNKAAWRALKSGGKNVFGRPAKVKRAWDEAVAISRANSKDAVTSLRAAGHKIGVLQSNADPVFPAKRIAANMDLDQIDGYASNVRKRAGHDELLIEAGHGAVAADQMLRSFEDPKHPSLLVDQAAKQDPRKIESSLDLAVRIKNRWQDSKLRETFVTGEKANRNRLIAAGIGAVALAAGLYAAKKGFDLPFDVGGGNGGGEAPDPTTTTTIDTPATTTTVPETPGLQSTPELPAPRGDISAELNLPDNYLIETADGYEITALPGAETDSIWRAAEHALTDHLGKQPTVVQIDALKDILGEHLLDVGDTVSISNDQLDRALAVAQQQTA